MHDAWWILLAILILVIGALFESQFQESFETPSTTCDTTNVDSIVTGIYEEILERYPSRLELIQNRREILSGNRTFDDVRQRLLDSSEYSQKIKMQSNALTPELPKMISDSRLLRKLVAIYKTERLKDCPPKMVLPLKDIYIKLDYKENVLRYMLRSEKWANFEQDIMLDPNFDVTKLNELIDDIYGGIKKITQDSQTANVEPSAADVNSKVCRMIEDRDGDSTQLLNNINSNASYVFNKDAAGGGFTFAGILDSGLFVGSLTTMPVTTSSSNISTTGSGICTGITTSGSGSGSSGSSGNGSSGSGSSGSGSSGSSGSGSSGSGSSGSGSGSSGSSGSGGSNTGMDVLVRPHYGDMVLRPEFAWSVPQPRAPVCTTLGKPVLVQPVVLDSSTALNATPLGEAADTGVGSIMPQFTYKEYVHLQ